MKWKYGIRGALKPPVNPSAGWEFGLENFHPYLLGKFSMVKGTANLHYKWRYLCWSIDSYLYYRTGLPNEWHDWYRSKKFD